MEQLGPVWDAWNLTATLVPISSAFPEAELLGTVSIKHFGGYFNFSDLAVSHAGTYKIVFEVRCIMIFCLIKTS